MDQIGQQSHRARSEEYRHLQHSSHSEDGEAEQHCAHARARAHDRAIDQTVRMPVGMRLVVDVPVTHAMLPWDAGARRYPSCIETCSA